MNKTVKNALFGMIGGVAGTFVIGQAMSQLSRIQSSYDKERERNLVPEDPRAHLVRNVSKTVAGRSPSPRTKSVLAQVVHFGYGTFWGGVYGLLRNRYPASRRYAALPFGAAFGAFSGDVLLPVTGLTPPPQRFPASSHARDLTSHYAYAATVEGVCQILHAADRYLARRRRLRRVA